MTKKVSGVLQNITVVLSVALLAGLCACSLIWQVNISMDAGEKVYFERDSILFYILMPIVAILFFRLGKGMEKIRPGLLFAIFAAVYAAAGAYLILGVDSTQRGDPAMILKYVEEFNAGDYSGFLPGKYINIYPIQLGFLTYERLLARICTDLRFFFAVNLGLAVLINFVTLKITALLSEEDRTAENYAVLLSFAFLPQFFYILWLYGQIPGLCFTMLSVWMMIREFRGRGKWNWLFMGLFMAAACLLKPNYKIAAIAVGLTCLLELLRRPKRRTAFAILFLILAVIGSEKLLNTAYRQASGIAFGEGSPMILHVTMGLQDSGNGRLGGWYNGYTFDTYRNNGCDSSKAAQAGWRDFYERIDYLRSHPGYAVRFFGRKAVSTWCDPTYQSLWCGPLEDCGQYTHTFLLQSIYTAGVAREVLKLIMHAVSLLIWGLTLVYYAFGKRLSGKTAEPFALYPLLYLLGGFLYHLISETKSEYVYMYVFSLIPAAAVSAAMLSRQMHECGILRRKRTGTT